MFAWPWGEVWCGVVCGVAGAGYPDVRRGEDLLIYQREAKFARKNYTLSTPRTKLCLPVPFSPSTLQHTLLYNLIFLYHILPLRVSYSYHSFIND